MDAPKPLHAFEGFGIELEFAIVDLETFKIKSIADRLLAKMAGHATAEFTSIGGGWSKELARHVIELKTNGTMRDLVNMQANFQSEIEHVTELLAQDHAALLSCGMHPFMDPASEGELWPDEDFEIYEAYDRIFGCHGHGWFNLQSIHINLPFFNDEEFGRLHSAVRLVLPLIPGIAASSPFVEGKPGPVDDNRLTYYLKNQIRIPEITGLVIPEPAWTQDQYEQLIFQPIYQAIRPYDPQGILQEEWLNSRGAIARFDRQAIEIRLIDKQESLTADFTIISAVIALIQDLYQERWSSYEMQKRMETRALRKIFDDQLYRIGSEPIHDMAYLELFGMKRPLSSIALWQNLQQDMLKNQNSFLQPFANDFRFILENGNLSQRLRRGLPVNPEPKELLDSYRIMQGQLISGGFYR